MFCVLYQLHHQKQVHLEDVPRVEKMESVRSQVTGARHAKCHFAWYCALENTTRKATEFLTFFFFLNFISFFVGVVNFLSNKNCSPSSFCFTIFVQFLIAAFGLRSMRTFVTAWFYLRILQGIFEIKFRSQHGKSKETDKSTNFRNKPMP